MMQILRATYKDAEAIAKINVTTWKVAYKGLIADEILENRVVNEDRIEHVRQWLSNPDLICLKAVKDGNVIGFLGGGKPRDKIGFMYEIGSIYVLPEFFRQGVGKALFCEFRKIIGNKSFYLYMLKGNERAWRFYEKEGGILLSQYNKSITQNGFVIDEVFIGFNKPVVYLMQGFLGAGKSTISQKVADKTGGVILCPDKWCVELFSKDEYENNWADCFSETMKILWKKAEEYIKFGKSVIFDAGFWTYAERVEAKKQIELMGAEYKHYYIFAPDDVLKKRIATRCGKIAEYNLEHFDEIKTRFEEPKVDEFVEVVNNI